MTQHDSNKKTQALSIQVLGGGCAKCRALEAAAKAALAQLHMDTAIGHVTDHAAIAAFGVMSTPALAVNGKVVCSGRVLRPEDVAALLKNARGEGE